MRKGIDPRPEMACLLAPSSRIAENFTSAPSDGVSFPSFQARENTDNYGAWQGWGFNELNCDMVNSSLHSISSVNVPDVHLYVLQTYSNGLAHTHKDSVSEDRAILSESQTTPTVQVVSARGRGPHEPPQLH